MRRRRLDTTINYSVQADIGLLLLTFFLMTSTVRKPDQGVLERLLPWFEETTTQSYPAERRLLLTIDEANVVRYEGRLVTSEYLASVLERWYGQYGHDPAYHVTLDYSAHCTFAAYLGVKSAILHAHRSLRREEALDVYGSEYEALPWEKRRAIIQELPLRLSETTRIWRAEGETEKCDVLIY